MEKIILKTKTLDILYDTIERHPQLLSCKLDIIKVVNIIIESYNSRGKLMICGNGGSAADSEHIAGELVKGFNLRRALPDSAVNLFASYSMEAKGIALNLQEGLPAYSLVSPISLNTAIINDIGSDYVFAQQVYGLGNMGDVLMGISTSGNAANVINSLITARCLGVVTVGLTGESGGKMIEHCDCIIRVPEKYTPLVQELHLPVYHAICGMVEEYFFGGKI